MIVEPWKAFPPSGKIISLMGMELNSCPRDLLLQVIEWQIASRVGDFRLTEEQKGLLQAALYLRLREFKPEAEAHV